MSCILGDPGQIVRTRKSGNRWEKIRRRNNFSLRIFWRQFRRHYLPPGVRECIRLLTTFEIYKANVLVSVERFNIKY